MSIQQPAAVRSPVRISAEKVGSYVSDNPFTTFFGRILEHDPGTAVRAAEARSERAIARRLRRLPDKDWTVINDLNLAGLAQNVDHLVIGAAGVFCLSTNNHRGKAVWVTENSMRVNNFPVEHVNRARACSRAVHENLSRALGRDIHVRSVVVVLTDNLAIRTQPLGASVVQGRRIGSWLQSKPRYLDPDEAAAIATAALRPDTWATEQSEAS